MRAFELIEVVETGISAEQRVHVVIEDKDGFNRRIGKTFVRIGKNQHGTLEIVFTDEESIP